MTYEKVWIKGWSGRCWWNSERRMMTYEKVWIKGVEWVGGRHG